MKYTLIFTSINMSTWWFYSIDVLHIILSGSCVCLISCTAVCPPKVRNTLTNLRSCRISVNKVNGELDCLCV